MRSRHRPRQRLLDIVENVDRILRCTAGMDEQAPAADERTSDAVERCIARTSEAAVRPGDQGPVLAPDLPWRDIRGIGNITRHACGRIETRAIWNIVADDLPKPRAACTAALARLPPTGEN